MVSIIIPIYNQTKKLDECLESIKNQTYSNYEIIVVNDRSTESMSKVIKKYQHEFGIKMEVINCQSRQGAPHARNRGFKNSQGEFVLFCDADAVLNPETLEIMLNTLKSYPEASYVYSSHLYGYKLFRSFPFDPEKLKQMPYIHTTSLIRREHFPELGWDESIKKLQDWDLWLTMLEQGHKGFWIDQVLFKIKPGGVYSSWLPSLTYKLLPFLPKVKKYKEAMRIVKEKHGLI